jgi:predicted transcriptional regulator
MQDMSKRNISVRILPELFSKLKELSEVTRMSNTDLVTEAIAQYCGVNIETVGSRLEKLKREVAALQHKFRVLSS